MKLSHADFGLLKLAVSLNQSAPDLSEGKRLCMTHYVMWISMKHELLLVANFYSSNIVTVIKPG